MNTRENIHVAIRFRPPNSKELGGDANFRNERSLQGQYPCIEIAENTITASRNTEVLKFTYDYVFDFDVSQEDIFKNLVHDAVLWTTKGYNTTIFAYGPSGSGKTHTMFGDDYDNRGVIHRACELLFHTINDDENVVDAKIKCSFLEIYRENIRDLLVPRSASFTPSLRIRQHTSKGIYVNGLIEKFVYTPDDVISTIRDGAHQRSTGTTAINDSSSRSHAVLTLIATQTMTDGTEMISKLNLIDLAGSENIGKSEATGVTLLEAQQINKSLSSLGNVIYALTEKSRDHIPYRDSKLTYLLQDSLGGNSKTILIATASPSIISYSETLNTLKFAKRAKEIKNTPIVNRNESHANLIKTIEMQRKKIEELQRKYDDAQAIVSNIEKLETKNIDTKTTTMMKTKIQRLEHSNEFLKQERFKDGKRLDDMHSIFDRQRSLAQKVSGQLYLEKIRACRLANELEQYKLFYESVKNANSNIVDLVVKHFKIEKKLQIETDFVPNVAELDSP